MKPITLKEFRSISLVSDSALVWLLENNALPVVLDKSAGLMIDMDGVEMEKLLQALSAEKDHADSAELNLLAEHAGKVLRDNFDIIVEEALARINQK